MEPLPASAPPAAPAANPRRAAAVQIAVVVGSLVVWALAFKLVLLGYLRAHLPKGWVYLDILGNGLVGLAVLAVVLRRWRQDWKSVGLRPTPALPAISWGLVATVPCYAAGIIVQLIALAALRTDPTQLARQKLQGLDVLSDVPFVLMVPLALFAGVYEEILFRGFLLSRLTAALEGPSLGRRAATAWAVALSSLLFGLGHSYQGVAGMLQTCAVGTVLCVLAVIRGEIWSCIAAHAAIDIFGLFALKVLRPWTQKALEAAKAAAAHAADAGAR